MTAQIAAAVDTYQPSQIRDARSDYLKAVAITGVVLIHTMLPCTDVFRFGVPVFVTLFAYYYELALARRGARQTWSYATYRFFRLLVPFAFWTSLYLPIFHPLAEWRSTPVRTMLAGWLGGSGWSGQYFLVVLLQLVWVVPLIRHWVGQHLIWLVLAVGAGWNIASNYLFFQHALLAKMGSRLIIYWLPYVFLGMAFARGYPARRPWLVWPALVLLAAIPVEEAWLLTRTGPFSPYMYATGTMGSLLLLLAAGPRAPEDHGDGTSPTPAQSWVLAIGRNSLGIYVMHLLVLEAGRRAGVGLMPALLSDVGRLGIALLAIPICVFLARFIRQMGLGILVGH